MPHCFMEQRPKLRGVGAPTKCRIDRFTSLPDHLVHHILSFVAITDLTRFGCASKKCRELYLSTPSLNLNGFSRANLLNGDKRLELLSSLDRFLLVHRGVNKLKRLCIFLNAYRDSKNEAFRIITWIHSAVRCNVEVLELDIGVPDETLPFPSSVFHCGSLRSLLVKMSCRILKAPSLTSFSNLEYLKLTYVIIGDEGIFKWISCCCKCIETLILEHAYGIKTVTIQSSSLKSFRFVKDYLVRPCNLNISGGRLEDIFIDWGFNSDFSRSLNISAPDLKYLKWSGNLLTQQNLGKMTCLQKAELFLKPEADDFNMFEILCSINRVEVLILNKETIMAMYKGGSMSAPLENVHYLSIHIGSFLDILVLPMALLLQGMPNLTTLDMKSDPFFLDPNTDCSGFNMGFWKVQSLDFVHQLREVTIELSSGSNGIEFARYILEHAQNLNKMTIVHSPHQSNAIRALKKSNMAANAKVAYLEDQNRGTEKQRGRRVAR
ncbi:putative F-box/FBD/LRR-repeat protein At4g03220 [Rosa rugosa]|uniref:putative F-box/FBD/LRR-repeat protein At4g03220 n=1 Tax=Rosa rugosa TaxID=74645 RepID=UPI002B40F225|nr:putative F-box/FBD/LRR-repeat protein At4g03220 [Rosa rugosa]